MFILPCEHDRSDILHMILPKLTQNVIHNKISVPFENWLDYIVGSRETTPKRGTLSILALSFI